MSTGFENQEKIAQLPQEGVHCFAANSKQVTTRRVITIPLMLVFLALGIYMLCTKSYVTAGCSLFALLITVLVFIQSFLIANYRVAVDYNEKRIVLRYRFSLITIPFENFDAHHGAPDKKEEIISAVQHTVVKYLVLDDVFEDACYQTSTKDLDSIEDFEKLSSEAFAIAEAYGAKNCEGVIKPDPSLNYRDVKIDAKELDDNDIDSIIADALEVDTETVKELTADAENASEEN